MPVPTNSRYEQLLSSPSRSSYPRTPSNHHSSYSPTVTGPGQQKLNVVTRLAIEGRAKQGQDGASIRMFLKICIPLDSVTPGSTIPLFPEENVKIHTSQVHPLDGNSVPYNFSSAVSPLLHNAARALSLPARSNENFNSAFNLGKANGSSTSSRSLKPENEESIPPIDLQYTGHIIVSGYSISFVLPKIFLSRQKDLSDTEGTTPRTPLRRKSSMASMAERNQAHFMAAVDMWVPFLSKPPRFPFLLSIPSPRCLHNHIKLRIFPPPVTNSSSFASLSSVEDDIGAWDLTSDPHVTRNASSRPSRSHSHFADDESSDSSNTNQSEGCIIQGTFPSAERIRIRWAKPTKFLNIPSDEGSRRRVGVEEVKGEMVCVVRGKGRSATNHEIEGVLMDVEYKGQCKGIWFPGVATLLGLDIGLQAKGSDISWPQGHPTHWKTSGSEGYTGFDNGLSSAPPAIDSKAPSLVPNGPQPHDSTPFLTTRISSGSSTSSLLRSPLPVQTVADYSFEGSNGILQSSDAETSSILSLPTSSTPSHPQLPRFNSPGSPVTLHLNMNDLQSGKSTFNFTISGTILLTPRTTLSRINGFVSSTNGKPNDPEPVVLPRFTVLAADSESTSTAIRNDVEGASVEVFNPTGDIKHDPQAKKTVLQKFGSTKCSEDGTRIVLKYFDASHIFGTHGYARPTNRSRTPSNNVVIRGSANSPNPRSALPTRNPQDGSPIIPWVKATVTALSSDSDMFPTGYAVRLTLQTPSLLDSEWLEFGMASRSTSTEESDDPIEHACPKVQVICASIDGIPVEAETTTVAKEGLGAMAGIAAFEELSRKEWICWGKVYTGTSVGGSMMMDYIVKEQDASRKWRNPPALNIILPTFFLSIGRLEVYVDVIPGLEIISLRSNFDYHHALPDGNRLLRFSVEEFSQPRLSFFIQKNATKDSLFLPGLKWYFALTWTILFVALGCIYRLMLDLHQTPKYTDGFPSVGDPWKTDSPTVTITTTVYGSGSTGSGCLFEESSTISLSSSTVMHMQIPVTTTYSTSTSKPEPTTAVFTMQPLAYTDATKDETPFVHTPSRSLLEDFGLIPIENLFPITWPKEHSDALKRVLGKVAGTMEVVWNIFRKVYHYPLDPP